MGHSGLFSLIFGIFKNNFKGWNFQRDLKLDCRSRRRAHWPLDQHHGPRKREFIRRKTRLLLYMTASKRHLNKTDISIIKTTFSSFQWFKNDAPVMQERSRVSVKTKLKGDPTQWSVLKFTHVETLVRDYSFSKDVKRKDFFLLDHDRHREKAFSTVPKTNEIHADIIRMTLEMGDNVLTVWQVGIPKVGGRNV